MREGVPDFADGRLEMCTPTRVVSSATEPQTAVVAWKAVLYGAHEQWGQLSAAQLTTLLAETA